MSSADVDLYSANNRFQEIVDLHESFVEKISSSQAGRGAIFSVEVSIESIVVKVFGYEFKSYPRVVRSPQEDVVSFYMEYIFECTLEEETVEVARFYLAPGGFIVDSTETNGKIFEYNNMYVQNEIGRFVAQSSLMSALFKPASSNA